MKNKLLQLINSLIQKLRERVAPTDISRLPTSRQPVSSSQDSPVSSCCPTLRQRIRRSIRNTWHKASHRFATTGLNNLQSIQLDRLTNKSKTQNCQREIDLMKFTLEPIYLEEVETELGNIISSQLESIQLKLNEQFYQNDSSTYLIDDLHQIYCLINKTKKSIDQKEPSSYQKIHAIHRDIKLILEQIKIFQKQYQTLVPQEIFQSLVELQRLCAEHIENLASIWSLLPNINSNLYQKQTAKSLKNWANDIELFTNFLSDNINFLSNNLLNILQDVSLSIIHQTSKSYYLEKIYYRIITFFSKTNENLEREFYRKKLKNSAFSILDQVLKRKRILKQEEQELTQDLLFASESAFSKIWLDPEEDEAWKEL